MRRQYTRFYYDDDGRVTGVATQDTPFPNADVGLPNEAHRKEVMLDLDDEGHHVPAGQIGSELTLQDERVVVVQDKPKEERVFTLRQVLNEDGVKEDHR